MFSDLLHLISLILPMMWPSRRSDSLCGTLSPGEVSASRGVAAPMARCRTPIAGSRTFLSHSVTPPQRGGCLSLPTRNPFPGADRAHGDRLRARWLSAGVADAVGSLFTGSASGRPGDQRGLRRLRTADRLSVGRQPLWPQPFTCGAAAPLLAG